MTPKEFGDVTDELLISPWGQAYYPVGHLQRLYKMVADLSANEFRGIVDQVNMADTRAPSLGKIQAACMPAINRTTAGQRQRKLNELQATDHPCPMCAGSGMITAMLRKDPTYEYSFRCNECKAADIMGLSRTGFTSWGPHLEAEYIPAPLSKTGLQDVRQLQIKFQEAEVLRNVAKRLLTNPAALKRLGVVPAVLCAAFPDAVNAPLKSPTDMPRNYENPKDDIRKSQTYTEATPHPLKEPRIEFPWEDDIPPPE